MNIRSFTPFAAIEPLLAQHGIRLIVQSVDYATGTGAARSDLWLGSANFYLPLEFSLFATLYELPLMQHCMNEDLAQDAALWRANRLPLAEFCQRLVSNHQLHPLFHHWLQLHGQRSMRGVRMNTLGWFDFKSASVCLAGGISAFRPGRLIFTIAPFNGVR